MQSFLQRYRVVLLHLSFWCVYLSFSVYQINQINIRRGREYDWPTIFGHAAIQMAFIIAIAYLNYFYLQPRFLVRKKVGWYLLEFLVPFVLLIILRIHVQRYLVDGYTYREHYFYSTGFVVQIVAITLFIVIFIGMLRFATEWFELESKKKEVANEKLTAELNFLKAQINPHFLFNTLNNLYYLAYTQSPNTTEVIAKLSQMMRYMIYDSNHPQVLLSKEIEYMQNYISLERLRLNNQIPIRFEVHGNPQKVWITPLILITFLENAFKHGVSHNQPDAWVNILITVNEKECVYTVENSRISAAHTDTTGKSGIGLQNVQRRLELSYPGQYQLAVEDEPERYAVQLNLTLC